MDPAAPRANPKAAYGPREGKLSPPLFSRFPNSKVQTTLIPIQSLSLLHYLLSLSYLFFLSTPRLDLHLPSSPSQPPHTPDCRTPLIPYRRSPNLLRSLPNHPKPPTLSPPPKAHYRQPPSLTASNSIPPTIAPSTSGSRLPTSSTSPLLVDPHPQTPTTTTTTHPPLSCSRYLLPSSRSSPAASTPSHPLFTPPPPCDPAANLLPPSTHAGRTSPRPPPQPPSNASATLSSPHRRRPSPLSPSIDGHTTPSSQSSPLARLSSTLLTSREACAPLAPAPLRAIGPRFILQGYLHHPPFCRRPNTLPPPITPCFLKALRPALRQPFTTPATYR